jgi:TetR/AcrR family transcriptional regulator
MAMRAKRLPADERKKRIIESARDVFAASNYWKISTADLAKAAGVSEPALYRYFPGKKDLFLSTLKTTAPKLIDNWQRIASEVDDPLEILWSIGVGYYDHLKSRSAVMKVQFQALVEADDPDIRKALHENFASFIAFFAEILEDGKRRGSVREDVDSQAFAWHFLGMGLTLDTMHLLGFDDSMTRQSVEAWVSFFIDSLRAEQQEGRLQPVPVGVPYDHLPSVPASIGEINLSDKPGFS